MILIINMMIMVTMFMIPRCLTASARWGCCNVDPDNVSNMICLHSRLLDDDDNVFDSNPMCLTAVARWGWMYGDNIMIMTMIMMIIIFTF